MSFVPIPNGVRVVHVGHIGGQQIINTIGAENKGGLLDGSLAGIAKRHGDAWRAQILPNLEGHYWHDATLAYSLEDQSKAAGDAGYSSAVAGGAGNDSITPANVAMVVSFKTAKRGRTYQGRTFLSGVGLYNYSGDGLTWKQSQLAVFQTKWAAYKAAVDPALDSNGRMAVCSHGSTKYGIAPHVEPVTAIICRPGLGTQRRRVS